MANSRKDNAKPKMPTTKKAAVFDVAHPSSGKLTAGSTSKPVIVSNRPVMQDPMVVADGPAEVASTAPVLTPTKKKVIMPSSDFKLDTPEPQVSTPSLSKAVEPKIPAQPDAADPIITTETGKEVTMLEPVPKAGVPALKREEKELTTEQAVAAEKSAQEREARLADLIEKEEYFLPINATQARRSRRVAIIGLFVIIVLALAWYNVALDAGLLPNQYDIPHTSFFTIK